MAAAVSAPSTLRFISGCAGLYRGSTGAAFSGWPVLMIGGRSLKEVEVGTARLGRGAAETKATGLAPWDGDAETAATGALLTGALWRPTE
jgi:hypothetical protein